MSNFWGALHFGNGVKQDYSEAVRWYRKAVKQDNPDAQCMLGVCYELGNGVNQDFVEADKWYHLAAEQGDVVAQCILGDQYFNGEWRTQDYSPPRPLGRGCPQGG